MSAVSHNRIVAAETRIIEVPLARPVSSATHRITATHNIAVRLRSDNYVGFGYAVALAPAHARAIDEIARDIASRLVGQPGHNIVLHWTSNWEQLNFLGQAGPGVSALSAVDTALWDLHAQRLGLPLHRVLGSGTSDLPVYATGGWLSMTTEELIEEAASLRELGFRSYKMKVGMSDPRDDVERVGAVRESTEGLTIILDANQAWSPAEAIRVGRMLDQFGVAWLEEPVHAQDLEGSARVARAIETPVCAGETLFGPREIRRLIEARAADIVNADLMRCGGITGLLRVAHMAAAHGIQFSPHTFLETSRHVAAATESSGPVEYVPAWWDRLFDEPFQFEEGRILLTDRSGIGLGLSEDAENQLTVRRWEKTA